MLSRPIGYVGLRRIKRSGERTIREIEFHRGNATWRGKVTARSYVNACIVRRRARARVRVCLRARQMPVEYS